MMKHAHLDSSFPIQSPPLESPKSRGPLAALVLLAMVLAFAPLGAAGNDADSSRVDGAEVEGSPADSALEGVVVIEGGREVLPATQRPFGPGERLKFSVQYGIIHAGTAYLEVTDVKDYEGRPVYTLVARAESNAFFSRFYKVRNYIESYMDQEGRYSRRFYESRREGGFRKKEEIRFDQARRQAIYPDGTSLPIPPQVQDALSSFYYTRFLPLPVGGSVLFDYHASRKSLPLEVKVLGREQVETPAGKYSCVLVEPILKAGGIFKKKGRLWIWLTDDERRLPVQMKSKVTIGSVSVVLVEAKPGA